MKTEVSGNPTEPAEAGTPPAETSRDAGSEAPGKRFHFRSARGRSDLNPYVDRLKETVPIFKKEVYEDGSTWKSS